jgi:hypothetical protein
MTPRLAIEAISSRLTCLPIESLPLTQCVGGTLRENVYAERDQPPFDRVTMDGIAVDSEALRRGLRRFRIQGTQACRGAAAQAAKRAGCHRSHDRRDAAVGQRLRDSRRAAASRGRVRHAASRDEPFAVSQHPSARQRHPPGPAVAGGRYAVARSGNCRGRFSRHGARAGQQPAGHHGGVDR